MTALKSKITLEYLTKKTKRRYSKNFDNTEQMMKFLKKSGAIWKCIKPAIIYSK